MENRVNILATLGIGALLSLSTPTASASLYLFEYTGTVKYIFPYEDVLVRDTMGFQVGQTIAGSFIVDYSVPDVNSSSIASERRASIRRFVFGSYSADFSSESIASYFIVDADPARDVVNAFTQTGSGPVYENFSFMLESPAANAALVNDSVDLTTLNLGNFDLSDSRFEFSHIPDVWANPMQQTAITAFFSTLRVTEIPEPATLALVAAGLLGSAVASRRRPRVRCTQLCIVGVGSSTSIPRR